MAATSSLNLARPARRPVSVRGALAWLVQLDARFRTRAHLARLDDRALADINISRADVMAELRRPFRL